MTVAQDREAGFLAEEPDGRAVCVELDGTLLRIGTLHESAFSSAFHDWRVVLRIPGWLIAGKARLEAELAARWTFDPATLPYNLQLLDRLRAEHDAGRRLVLCTTSDLGVAQTIASHLGLFDEVIATGATSLRGATKAEILQDRFGERGFVYAGHDATDLAVWDRASGAILVNAPDAVRRAVEAQGRVVGTFDDREPIFRALLRAMRPYQWVKNALCFVPPIAAGNLGLGVWLATLGIAAAFCCIASGLYILNDIADLAADRAHPRKALRPFASGAAPIAAGLALAPVLILAGLALGVATNGWPALILYLAVSLVYTTWLKEKSLLDVFALAALYSMRLFGGGEVSGHPVTLWLLAFSLFLFLSLALIKRVSELRRLRETGAARKSMRRGYTIEDIAILEMFGVAATFTSALVLSLYVQSTAALNAYGNPATLWGAIPLLLFWQCQLWLATVRGRMHDDPILYAARDQASWVVLACLACIVVVARLPTMGH